jgi:hypothetical protein
MRPRLAAAAVLIGVVLAAHVWAQPPWAPAAQPGQVFQGYWMGVDPVDGGDARRSLVQLADGRYALAARDTVFSLCDSTDRGFGSFDDGVLVARGVLVSDSLTLRCFNNGASVTLHVRYELIADGLMNEITTRADGTLVSTIVFHRVSE